jgi:hypothetical protein
MPTLLEIERAAGRTPGMCEHGIQPWYNCDICRKTSKYGFNMKDYLPGQKEALVLGENLTEDGKVIT